MRRMRERAKEFRADVWRRVGKTAPTFHPEFGRFMLEATPGAPWGIGFKDLLDVEPDMKWRCVPLVRVHC